MTPTIPLGPYGYFTGTRTQTYLQTEKSSALLGKGDSEIKLVYHEPIYQYITKFKLVIWLTGSSDGDSAVPSCTVRKQANKPSDVCIPTSKLK
jgi:hypothetical protein